MGSSKLPLYIYVVFLGVFVHSSISFSEFKETDIRSLDSPGSKDALYSGLFELLNMSSNVTLIREAIENRLAIEVSRRLLQNSSYPDISVGGSICYIVKCGACVILHGVDLCYVITESCSGSECPDRLLCESECC
ncbi:hypothetical protein Gasu2_18410 [Galdieria sulphuraria]|uniref:Uncharacterized protein n=1 Tax=Galdieria sulphuraria TaxID=130081 RepID=M2VWJ9_GALSU|nr:uncharacterized protein Gasu_47720 [Galdieria sulphuraria]EME27626.1 hypothetical protein Gasu_47720 [Galdieria sulphuraria]GJD07482.1 hypothetical protein Gasu2_18410 [Galdieria sulphuraria]|eukprot:XP_005704146.1 hypothetical protein Gasu_47720 [Galdieria sulphuraria]